MTLSKWLWKLQAVGEVFPQQMLTAIVKFSVAFLLSQSGVKLRLIVNLVTV